MYFSMHRFVQNCFEDTELTGDSKYCQLEVRSLVVYKLE